MKKKIYLYIFFDDLLYFPTLFLCCAVFCLTPFSVFFYFIVFFFFCCFLFYFFYFAFISLYIFVCLHYVRDSFSIVRSFCVSIELSRIFVLCTHTNRTWSSLYFLSYSSSYRYIALKSLLLGEFSPKWIRIVFVCACAENAFYLTIFPQ